MSDGLEKLRSIGAQKIHEDTHISLSNIQSILDENFEKIQKVQLLGFVSILEREYKIDLEPFREKVREYFETLEETQIPKNYVQEEKLSLPLKHKLLIGLLFILLLVMIGSFYAVFSKKETKSENIEEHSQTLNMQKSDTQSSEPIITQKDLVQETNTTNTSAIVEEKEDLPKKAVEVQEHQKEKKVIAPSFVIIPRTKVWLGYIDLTTHKKKQTVTKNPIELNASRNYLLTFGHGYIDVKLGDEIKNFKKAKSIKFLYEDGVLKEISSDEFRARNKGKLW
ncbi:MAG: hypothetical protein GXO11_00695 [Epsilonproteobacteria bacterium]|nr:hypothetical protein [Campylobacterota bacterium]